MHKATHTHKYMCPHAHTHTYIHTNRHTNRERTTHTHIHSLKHTDKYNHTMMHRKKDTLIKTHKSMSKILKKETYTIRLKNTHTYTYILTKHLFTTLKEKRFEIQRKHIYLTTQNYIKFKYSCQSFKHTHTQPHIQRNKNTSKQKHLL